MRAHHVSWLIGLVLATPLTAQVRPGIDVLLTDSVHLVQGRRLGLLSNQTGVDRQGRRDVDVLRAHGLQLLALFSPEHGFQGKEDRPGLPDATDSATGLPIYSLYGGSEAKADSALETIDVLLIDLQDIGARYYTYPASATSLMRDATRLGKPVIVLDRPNPLGGVVVQGNPHWPIADPDTAFVGFLPVPMRHGMTLGELLRLANDALDIHARLTVIPAAGWRRVMTYDSTGLPWVKPSPNMPDLESAFHYPGTCLFEGTNLSVGRGTSFAFQAVGAPWVNAEELRRAVGSAAGVAIDTITFTPSHPTDGKYDGVAVHGVRLRVTDRRTYDPTRLAVRILLALHHRFSRQFEFHEQQFDRLAGGKFLRQLISQGRPESVVEVHWGDGLDQFRRRRAKYLLY